MATLGAAFVHAGDVPLRVVYPRSESRSDDRVSYPLSILRLALEKSGRAYDLRANSVISHQVRSLRLLAEGADLDVVWSVTTAEREALLRAIRIPLDRGLIGWRVLIIPKGQGRSYAEVVSPSDLRGFVGVQGYDWPDLAILRSNQLTVAAGSSYDGLFNMIARGHADYFPRAVSEVTHELRLRGDAPIELEQTLLIHYPSALYFFVNKANADLAEAIQTGLERSLRDGSFRQRWDEEYARDLDRLNLHGRRTLEMANPLLPAGFAHAHPEWWFSP